MQDSQSTAQTDFVKYKKTQTRISTIEKSVQNRSLSKNLLVLPNENDIEEHLIKKMN